MVKRRGSFPFWDTGLPFQVLLLLFSGRVLSTKRSIISHPFLAPAWVDDFPKLPVWWDMDVSKNNGTPKSPILIGFSIINHPFWGYPYFWFNTHMFLLAGEVHLHGESNPHRQRCFKKPTSSTVASSWTWDSNASWEDKIPVGHRLRRSSLVVLSRTQNEFIAPTTYNPKWPFRCFDWKSSCLGWVDLEQMEVIGALGLLIHMANSMVNRHTYELMVGCII